MSLSFEYICRLCTKQNESLLPIFCVEDEGSLPSLSAKIASFLSTLKIVAGDGLPGQVCQQCVCQVDTCYKFKLQCENSDAALREILNNEVTENGTNGLKSTDLYSEHDPKARTLIKPEIKEEIFTDEHDQSDSKDQGLCDDFSESSNDSWPDLQVESSSSKVNNETKKVTECKKPAKITKRKKKTVKEENSATKDADSESADKNVNCVEETPVDSLKLEDSGIDKEVNGKMGVKKSFGKVFQCHDCGKNFAKKAQLVLHMSGHTGAKPYICNQCCRTFASRINLKKHLFTHTGEKPYLCTHCGIFFGRIDTLTKHMRSHTGEKPFNCNVCGNSFARRSTFTNHMRTHSGEKPYLCTECGWRCVQSYDLKKHMRCHTGEKPYHCSICRMSFGQRNSLTKHMRCHIGEVPISMECMKEMPFRCQVYGTKEFNNFPVTGSQNVDGQVP